jgi:hypothetical protein
MPFRRPDLLPKAIDRVYGLRSCQDAGSAKAFGSGMPFGSARLPESASLRRVIVLRVPIRLSAVRARGSQEAGRQSRGVEFAPDSPLEEGGFEPSVPARNEQAFQLCWVAARHGPYGRAPPACLSECGQPCRTASCDR